MLADIVILSNNIFDNRPESLRETAVTVTIFDGKIVYQRAHCRFRRLEVRYARHRGGSMATKITYATLGGDQLDDLHRELDEAIAKAPADVRPRAFALHKRPTRQGRRSSSRIAARSTRASCSARSSKARREHVQAAIAAARAALSGVGGAALAAAARLRAQDCRPHSQASLGSVRADGLRGRQEPARMRRRRRRSGRSHLVLLRSDRAARTGSSRRWARSGPAKKTSASCGRTVSGP